MSDYNDLISGDLAEASIPLIKALEANDLMNFRGIATMFALSSTMMNAMKGSVLVTKEIDEQSE